MEFNDALQLLNELNLQQVFNQWEDIRKAYIRNTQISSKVAKNRLISTFTGIEKEESPGFPKGMSDLLTKLKASKNLDNIDKEMINIANDLWVKKKGAIAASATKEKEATAALKADRKERKVGYKDVVYPNLKT